MTIRRYAAQFFGTLVLCLGLVSCGGWALAAAHGEGQTVGMDAGLGADAGAPAPSADAPKVMHDPVENPRGFADDTLHAFRAAQYAFFLVLVLFGISRGLLYVSDKHDVKFLDKHRAYILFSTSVLGGSVLSLIALSHIDLRVVLGAVASAAMLELRGRGKMSEASRAKSLYEAYATSTEWKSAVTGADLPQWGALPPTVVSGWLASAKVS